MPTRPRILLVEDDPTIAALIRFRLEREGMDMTLAADGNAAREAILSGEPPSLVLMDVMMPYRSGYELLADIRGHEAWKEVPVIMLTGLAREDDVVKALDLGATDFVSKPIRPAELTARIRSLLRKA